MECRIVDLQDLAYGFLDRDDAMRVRDHLDGCDRCRADFARLDAERGRLAGAAAGLSQPRGRRSLMPLAFAAALLAGLLWLLIPREAPKPAPVAAVVPAAQEKTAPKAVPDDEESIQKEILRLDAALKTSSDDQERSRIKATIGELKVRLQRAIRAKGDTAAMKEKEGEPKKPVKIKSDPGADRILKLKMEAKELNEKLLLSQDPAEKQRLSQRAEEVQQQLKMIEETLRATKKPAGSKGDRKPSPADLANQIATLRDRVEELRAMAANADLSAADRERAGRDADRVQAEIDRLTADQKK